MEQLLPGLCILKTSCRGVKHPEKVRKMRYLFVSGITVLFLSTILHGQPTYEAYGRVLTHVNKRGLVDYEYLSRHSENIRKFVRTVAEVNPDDYQSWDSTEQIAFLINAYNGLAIKLILDHYPIRPRFPLSLIWSNNSIRQIPGAFDGKTFGVMGRDMTLDDIEHGMLRKDFYEPRIHFAVVCASMGCPRLRDEPYTGENLSQTLDTQSRVFLHDSEKFRINREERVVQLSKYFDWYGEDFVKGYLPEEGYGAHDPSIRASLHFIAGYLENADAEYLRTGEYRVSFFKYDWSLNEQK